MTARLDKLISDSGLYSRREARQLIRSGRAAVGGVTVTEPEAKADPQTQTVTVDGRELRCGHARYLIMDKPAGVLCATQDIKQRTVLDLLPKEYSRMGMFPVGRLDKDTTGLLLITNDGDFAHRVISPASGTEKVYLAETEGDTDGRDAEAFARGVTLRDGTVCLPAKLEPLGGCRCLVTVREGKYHQVKRMLASRGRPVTALRRLSIGGLELEPELGAGNFREMTEAEKALVLGSIH